MTRQAILFANLSSGRASRFGSAIQLLAQGGIEVTRVLVDLSPESIKRELEQAEKDEIRLVLTFGGDGTIGSVVNKIVGTEFALGAIAGGTSNNFVRSLEAKPTIEGSIAAICSGHEVLIDVGQADETYFAHAAIIGLNVDFARRAQRYRKFLGRVSYPLASLDVYRRRTKLRLSVEQDGESRELATYQLTILNGGVFGGPLNATVEGAQVDTGRLRAVTVDDLSWQTILQSLPRAVVSQRLDLPNVQEFDVTDAEVRSETACDITLDGEIKARTPARIRIVPDALRVVSATRRID